MQVERATGQAIEEADPVLFDNERGQTVVFLARLRLGPADESGYAGMTRI